MFPGMRGMNPKQMKMMMKQLGIKSEEINAKRAIFELENGKITIENPSITAIEQAGQKIFTVAGKPLQEEGNSIPEEDIALVAGQCKVPAEKAKKALEGSQGDIAGAIKKLKGD